MNIYVGNIPYTVTDEDLRQTFGEFGTVVSTSIIIDKITGRSRGFGFVEMSTDEEGNRAIEEMNGKDWQGRTLTVNEAKPRERSFGGGGGGYSGGGAPRRSFDGPGRSDSGPREASRGGYGGGSPEFNRGGGGGYGGGGGRSGGGDRDRGKHGGGGRGGDRDRERGGGGKGIDRWQDDDEGDGF